MFTAMWCTECLTKYVICRTSLPKTLNPKPLNREARRPSRSSHFSGLGFTSVLSLRNLLVSFFGLPTMIVFHVLRDAGYAGFG